MNPRLPPCQGGDVNLQAFEDFLRVNMRLRPSTIKDTLIRIRNFLKNSEGEFGHESISNHLKGYLNHEPATYNGEIKALKRLAKYLNCNELMKSFKMAPVEVIPQEPPTREQIKKGFMGQENALSKALYLFIATTGLRKGEVLSLKKENVDFETRAVKPNHFTRTKRSGVTFYNEEAETWLREYLDERTDEDPRLFIISYRQWKKIWNRASDVAVKRITAKTLRLWQSTELGELGVPDRYVDIFQGRAPRSVIAKHYTGRELDRLKAIYEKARLRVFK